MRRPNVDCLWLKWEQKFQFLSASCCCYHLSVKKGLVSELAVAQPPYTLLCFAGVSWTWSSMRIRWKGPLCSQPCDHMVFWLWTYDYHLVAIFSLLDKTLYKGNTLCSQPLWRRACECKIKASTSYSIYSMLVWICGHMFISPLYHFYQTCINNCLQVAHTEIRHVTSSIYCVSISKTLIMKPHKLLI